MNQSLEHALFQKRPASLAVWMTSSVVLFVLLGSLALVLLFGRYLVREECRSFEALARANVDFLERTRLPQTEKMAAQLGAVIGARVYFWQPATDRVTGRVGDTLDLAALKMNFDGKVNVMPQGEWMIGLTGTHGTKVIFLRPAPARVLAVDRRETWWALGFFWLLSLALGWLLARGITRPLRCLAESLRLVGTEADLPDLPVTRRDEIGRLAETLTRTHHSLRQEREGRRSAERHALLGRMASSLAHEVRNPVTAIRLHAQLLEMAGPVEAAISRQLIESEAERIEELVGQWLSYAKPAPPVLAELDVAESVCMAVRLMEPHARHAGVRFTGPVMTGDMPLIIAADRSRMQQVFGNLLRNAIQAMPSGGCVCIGVCGTESRVEVGIEDEGVGFSAAALSRFGEPFYSEREGGMGLGLAVAKEICEAHGGRIFAENRSGGGARVRLDFAKYPVTQSIL